MLLVATASAGRCKDEPTLSADTAWQHVEDKAGVALYERARPGSGVKEFKGSGVINAPAAEVEKVLRDVAAYPAFMPYVTEAKVISEHGAETVSYQRLSLPLVSNRDYTVRIEHGTSRSGNGAVEYRDIWDTDNDAGPAEKSGVVRVKVNEGSWLLQPTGDGGHSTQATYQIYTDTGGTLPSFIANHASQTAIPKVFEAVRKQVLNAKYR